MNRIIIVIIIALSALSTLSASAEMLRVAGVVNSRTLEVERRGKRETIRLAGVAVALPQEVAARELLRWSVGTSWILAEPLGDEYLVYRSPDALFINRELVSRGYARATLPGIEPSNRVEVVYLGQFDPGPVIQEPEPRSGSGKNRRPKAAPRRSSGARRSSTSASGGSTPAAGRAPRSPKAGKGATPPQRSPD